MKILERRRHGVRRRAMLGGVAATASLLLVTACSGGGSEPGGSPTDASSESPAAGVLSDAMKPVTTADMPTKPFTPVKDKHILILTCGSVGTGCVAEAQVEKKLAESLGWKADVIDGKVDPTTWNQVVKQAAESGIDGIIAISADPNLYGEAMDVVKAKKIPFVVTWQNPLPTDVGGIGAYVAADPDQGGKDVAEWIKADSAGKANILVFDVPLAPAVQRRGKAMIDTLKADCPGCTVKKADISYQTLATSLTPQVTSLLQQDPKIDYIWGVDDSAISFVQQGIRVAGRASTVKLVSMTGYPDQMAQLKTGEMAAELATPIAYQGWTAFDSLSRLMAGAPLEKNYWPVPQRIFSSASIAEAPASVVKEGWNLDFDYESIFKKLWGQK